MGLSRWVVVLVAGCGRFGFESGDRVQPCGVADPGARCFELAVASVSWTAARDACETTGARLAVITSADDNASAAALAATIPYDASSTNPNQRQRMWLGGTETAEMWSWYTGDPLGYTNWRTGEPQVGNDEHCLILLGSLGGLWDDRACGSPWDAYLCER